MKIYIPMRGYDWTPEAPSCDLEYERFLNEITILDNDPRLIRLLDENEEKKYVLQEIRFSVITDYAHRKMLALSKKYPDFHSEYIGEYLIVDLEFTRKVRHARTSTFYPNLYLRQIAILLGLCYNTPIEFLPGVIINGRRYVGMTDYIGGPFNQAYDSINELQWPQPDSLTLDQVLNWLNNHQIQLTGISNGPASRAVMAYSHLFNYSLGETDSAFLFWCMLGIESLYAVGSNNILNQIHTKVYLILGEPAQFQKKLKRLYEYRSRLVHGDLNLSAKFHMDFSEPSFEYNDYVGFSASILITSIKRLIGKNLSTYEFQYSWKDQESF
jgi:hypothetical protein